MSEFRWFDRDFGSLAPGFMHNRAVVAGSVEFAPAHVVFRDHVGGPVILAVRNEQVADLRQVLDDPEAEAPSALAKCESIGYFHDHEPEQCAYPVHSGRHSWEVPRG